MSLCLYSSTDNAIELSTLRLKNKETKDFCEPLFHKNPDYTFLPIYKHFVSGSSLLCLRRQPFLIRHHSLRKNFNSFCSHWTNSKGKRLSNLPPAAVSKQAEEQSRCRGDPSHLNCAFCPSQVVQAASRVSWAASAP